MIDAFSNFILKFRQNAYEVIEYSFAEDPAYIGTMVYGVQNDFVNRAFDFSEYWENCNHWRNLLESIITVTAPTSYLFKVDWKNNIASTCKLYCRYLDEISIEKLEKSLLGSHFDQEMLLTLAAIEREYKLKPCIIGARVQSNCQIPISIYYHTKRLEKQELKLFLSYFDKQLKESDEQTQKLIDELLSVKVPEFVGIDWPENSAKIDFGNISIDKFISIVGKSFTDPKRQSFFYSLSNNLSFTSLNYFSIKPKSGFGFEWKAYFALSPRLFNFKH
jgi:hypothetical protein